LRVQTSDPVSLSPSQQSPIFFHSGFHSLSLGTTRLLSVHYSLQAQTEPPATQILLVGFFFYTRSFNRPEQKYANLIATVSPPPTLSIIKYSTSVFFFIIDLFNSSWFEFVFRFFECSFEWWWRRIILFCSFSIWNRNGRLLLLQTSILESH